MKKIICTLLSVVSFNVLADTITLKGGESIYMSGNVIKCEGTNNGGATGYAVYADLPWSKLKTLLDAGMGLCKIEYTQDLEPQAFYKSSRYISGLQVNSQSYGMIRNDIRQGNCD